MMNIIYKGKGLQRLVFIVLLTFITIVSANAIPKRIVSLSPAGSEILCAVGAFTQIVARTDYCDYPADMKSLPSVGGFDGKTLSLETIIKQRPDFVYGAKGMHDYLVTPLKKMGIEVYLSDANSIDAVLKEIAYIGQYTGHANEAKKIQDHISEVFTTVAKRIAGKEQVTVYYEVWNSPYMSIGKNSFINELITNAGGANIFALINEEYPMVSEEAIITRKPEVILFPDMEGESLETIQKRNGWQLIPAVRKQNIFFVSSDICSRPGPRITEALLIIAKALHPEISFDDIK